jgi:hypothetical protein
MGYYILENGQQYGPFTIEQLKKRGITTNTQVWREGMAQWTYVKNIPELIDIAQPPLPGGTPPPNYDRTYSPYGYNLPSPDRPYPNDHKTLAIIATIVTFLGCYFIPLGIVSLIYSLNVESKWKRGDYVGAEKYAKHAKIWGICTLVLPFLLWGTLFLTIIIGDLLN